MSAVDPTNSKTYLLVASTIEMITPAGEAIELSKAQWKALALFATVKEGVPLKDVDFLNIVPLRSVGVLINALRKKIGADSIVNVRSQGYVINKNLMLLRPTWSRPKPPIIEQTPTTPVQITT